MSKIRIYGDTSGYVDLTAPAVADNSEIDLSSPTFSGNVGIGTNTPNFPLTVETTNDYATAAFRSSGNEVNVEFKNTSTNGRNYKIVSGGAAGGFSGGKFGIYDATAGAGRLIVDPSGTITTPYQPAFVAYRSGGNVSGAQYLTYDVATVNIGNHYSTANGRFTAPVAGVYLFNIYDIGLPSQTSRFYLYKNGSTTLGAGGTHQLRIPNGSDYGSGLSYWMVSASANDYFQVYLGAGGSYGTNEYAWFYGRLLG